MTRTILTSLLLAVAACGGADGDATTTAQAVDAPRDTCVALYTRQRDCTDVYLPALVDARIAHDLPAGIAARADEPGGKDELLATARSEWANDSTDASIAGTCDGLVADLPAEQADALADQASACLAADTCEAFVDCVIPLTVSIWEAHAAS